MIATRPPHRPARAGAEDRNRAAAPTTAANESVSISAAIVAHIDMMVRKTDAGYPTCAVAGKSSVDEPHSRRSAPRFAPPRSIANIVHLGCRLIDHAGLATAI